MPLKPTTAMHKDRRTGKDGVKLQHRHFAFIASVIAGLPSHAPSLRAQKLSTASAFAEALAKTNPNFDRSRFFSAAGLPDPVIEQAVYNTIVEEIGDTMENRVNAKIQALAKSLGSK